MSEEILVVTSVDSKLDSENMAYVIRLGYSAFCEAALDLGRTE